jgi:hypothetical protein
VSNDLMTPVADRTTQDYAHPRLYDEKGRKEHGTMNAETENIDAVESSDRRSKSPVSTKDIFSFCFSHHHSLSCSLCL